MNKLREEILDCLVGFPSAYDEETTADLIIKAFLTALPKEAKLDGITAARLTSLENPEHIERAQAQIKGFNIAIDKVKKILEGDKP